MRQFHKILFRDSRWRLRTQMGTQIWRQKSSHLENHLSTSISIHKQNLSTDSSTSDQNLQNKLSEYSERNPVPISIAQFLERGRNQKFTEAESYAHIVDETLVRLAHLIKELQCLPQELRAEDEYLDILSNYEKTFGGALVYENIQPNQDTLRDWTTVLKSSKQRHKDTVAAMARACMNMKNKYGISLNTDDCALTRSVQYGLDRLYMSRISLNMLTDQHLMVYGHSSSVTDQIGVINPSTDIEMVVRHAYQNAQFLCEQCYLTAPSITICCQNATSPDNKITVTQVPSHVYHMVFEVLKNAMQATVDKHLDEQDVLPEIKVLICQSDRDITIRISDFGGGIPRFQSDKIFKYLYTTAPRASLTAETVPLSGLGYGLPLARLYARYFQGEIRAASYEGYGTDIYIYLQALAGEAVERLPVWTPESSTRLTARSSPMPDWTSKSGYIK
eukprot:TRINITY_DN8679_c0_g1_i1.p1 TRINITY_DN8679_c0_g1~~TRINITY_DN8679_c0_g1_i1.p1  ORF type:complete len:478 (-),score=48.01 TRINITY_DN8679_c0_g1_i1:478-1818(-)